jgi:hypothetical protein
MGGAQLILPDLEGDDADPHPDGKAWRKACPECAHRTSDPQQIGSAYQERVMRYDGTAVFYCLHRTDGDLHRVCACYAAMHRLPRIDASDHSKGAM